MYLDFEGDDGFEKATIIDGKLKETNFQPLFETDDDEYVEGAYNICPDCGCKINFENDGGNGFCVNCALIIEKWAATNNTVAAHFLFTLPPARRAPAAPLTPRPTAFHSLASIRQFPPGTRRRYARVRRPD